MKYKDPSGHEDTLSIVVLYEDDMERLINILSMSASANVSLEHRDVIYETPTELRDAHGNLIRELKLRATPTDANAYRDSVISFRDYIVYLQFDTAHELAFRQARDFLRSRCHWTAKWPTWTWLWVVPFIVFLLLIGAGTFIDPVPTQIVVLVACAITVGWMWASVLVLQRRNWIFLHKRHEHTGFVRRHESTIIKALFGLAGSIIGYVLRLLQE